MLKILPKKYTSGYTIIEIIVSISILIIIFTLAQAGYRQFILNRSLDSVREGVISELKLAQEYAISGRVPLNCDNIAGIVFTSHYDVDPDLNTIVILADCDIDQPIKTVRLSTYARNVRFGAPFSAIVFRPLGTGTNITPGSTRTISLYQITTGTTKNILVSSGGEIR